MVFAPARLGFTLNNVAGILYLMSNYVFPLNEAGDQKLSLVGGKALSLGKMLKVNMPVPPGFVITTKGFRNGLTDELKKYVIEAYNELGSERVAVRSSAVAEDSQNASWAGQLESFLNVTKDRLFAAVSECWESIESERSVKYAKKHNISQEQRAVAVVIQKMIDSDISGVIFTANPINKSKDEVVIESIFGLGELLVQGAVTPESLIIDKVSGEIRERIMHRQTDQLMQKDGTNILLKVDFSKVGQKVLSDDKIDHLLKTSKAIEQNFRSPQDIEWAYENDELYILQSRPITTL